MKELSEITQSIPQESLFTIMRGIVALVALIVLAIVAIVALRHDSSGACGIEIGLSTSGAPPAKFPDFDLGDRLVRVQDAGGKDQLMYCQSVSITTLRDRPSDVAETEQFAWAGTVSDGLTLMSCYKCKSNALGWIEVRKWYQEIASLSEVSDSSAAKIKISIDIKLSKSLPISVPTTLNDVPVVTMR